MIPKSRRSAIRGQIVAPEERTLALTKGVRVVLEQVDLAAAPVALAELVEAQVAIPGPTGAMAPRAQAGLVGQAEPRVPPAKAVQAGVMAVATRRMQAPIAPTAALSPTFMATSRMAGQGNRMQMRIPESHPSRSDSTKPRLRRHSALVSRSVVRWVQDGLTMQNA